MNKLVRDKIPDRIRAGGGAPDFRRAAADHARPLLQQKLHEEYLEYLTAEDVSCQADELVDLYEVILALWQRAGRTEDELRRRAADRRAEAGGFDELIVLRLEDDR